MNLFEDNRSSNPANIFSIKQNLDVGLVGSYDVTYSAYLQRYPLIKIVPSSTLLVTVKDPCANPLLTLTPPSTLTDQTYTLTDSPKTYQISPWVTNEAWCSITYSYSITSSAAVASPVISFDPTQTQRVFTFSYSADLVPSGPTSQSYVISVVGTSATLTHTKTFNLLLVNPCTNQALNAF